MPLLLMIALAVLLTSGRPILYRQERIGHLQRPFSLMKFRTMVPDAHWRLGGVYLVNGVSGGFFQ